MTVTLSVRAVVTAVVAMARIVVGFERRTEPRTETGAEAASESGVEPRSEGATVPPAAEPAEAEVRVQVVLLLSAESAGHRLK